LLLEDDEDYAQHGYNDTCYQSDGQPKAPARGLVNNDLIPPHDIAADVNLLGSNIDPAAPLRLGGVRVLLGSQLLSHIYQNSTLAGKIGV
jgi:hypothetical protein